MTSLDQESFSDVIGYFLFIVLGIARVVDQSESSIKFNKFNSLETNARTWW